MRVITKILKAFLLVDLLLAAAALIAKFTFKSEGGPDADVFRVVAIFDGAQHRSTAKALDQATVVAMFGGVQLDLRRAQAGPGGVTVRVTAVFGGVELIVPDTWAVTTQGKAFAGDVKAKVTEPEDLPPDAPHLSVISRPVFGGVNIVARPILKAAEA
jgi:predicted membrane protein